MKKIVFLLLISSLFVGCGIFEPTIVNLSSTITPEEFNKLQAATGKNIIRGSALVRQKDGSVVTCAGDDVILMPATTYAKERVNAIYGSTTHGSTGYYVTDYAFQPDVIYYEQLQRTASCDAQGNFVFDELPDGEYILIARVVWESVEFQPYYHDPKKGHKPPSVPPRKIVTNEGGNIMRSVSVKNNQIKEIVIAP